LQKAGVVHVRAPVAPAHMPEQQSDADRQDTPDPPQATMGDLQTPAPLEVSQKPEQQSFAAVQAVSSCLQRFDGSVQMPFAHALVQQAFALRHAPPAGLQVAVPTQTFPAQPSDSPAQQSDGTLQAWVAWAQRGTWQVRFVPLAGQVRPMQQSSLVRHGVLAPPQVGGGVQVPFVHESVPRQHGTVGEQAPLVAPQVAGGTQLTGRGEAAPSGSRHESAPLQQGFVAEQAVPVSAQVAGAVQTLFVHESAPLQHGTPAPQVEPVPAQVAGAVQTFAVQVSAPLQHGTPPAHEDPVPAQVEGAVQAFAPAAPAQAPAKSLQQSVSWRQVAPGPAQAAGAAHFPAAQTSVGVQHAAEAQEVPVAAHAGGGVQIPPEQVSPAVQHRSDAHDVLVAAQVGPGGGGVLDVPDVQAPSANAAATARTVSVGRIERNMASLPGEAIPRNDREKTTAEGESRPPASVFGAAGGRLSHPGGARERDAAHAPPA
jgi:hypothetical protein